MGLATLGKQAGRIKIIVDVKQLENAILYMADMGDAIHDMHIVWWRHVMAYGGYMQLPGCIYICTQRRLYVHMLLICA